MPPGRGVPWRVVRHCPLFALGTGLTRGGLEDAESRVPAATPAPQGGVGRVGIG